VQYPSSDPLVVAVGGTSLTLNSTAFYVAESTWSGSTAGSSVVFSKPTWQQGLGDSNRDTTDVSYDADPNSGVLVESGGKLFQVGGTSAGAPQWAALVSLASQANSARYGAAQPLLYKTSSYHDVTVGSNGFFAATVGWDYPTGLGSPNANATVKALAAGDFGIIASATPIALQAGSPGASSISVNSVGGFSGNVTLSVSTSSPLLSASLSPTVISLSVGKSGMSTLKLTAAAVGDYTITLTGTSGTSSHVVSITATVSSAAGGGGGGRIVAT
jgi:subtilase family serine protease